MKKSRIISLGLAALMLTGVSCGESGTTAETTASDASDTTTAEPVTTELTDGLEPADFGGWELTILNFNQDWLTWANTTITIEEADGDILNDAIYNRNANLQERFNFTFVETQIRDTREEISKNVIAGDNTYAVYTFSENHGISPALPYITDWNNIPNLTLDSDWWNPAATSVYNLGGKQVALAGNMSLSAVSRAVCMVFNKNVWENYGDSSVSLYDYVKNDNWTLDTYLSTVKTVSADLNGDSKMDANDLYGLNMGRGFKGYIASFLAGSGMNFTEKVDGKDVFTLHQNERGLDLVTKLVDALGEVGYYYNEDTSVHSFSPSDFFKNGHALFTQGVPHDIYKLRDMNDDIGILPMPKYDENQEKYYSASWGGAIWVLPKTFDVNADGEKLGTILEAMAFAGWKDVVPVYKEVALKTKTARDNESAEMLDIIFDGIFFDYGINLMYDAVCADSFLTDIWKAKSSDAIVSSITKALPKIERFVLSLEEGILEVE